MSDRVGFVAATLTTIPFAPQATRPLRTRNTASHLASWAHKQGPQASTSASWQSF